MSKIEKIKAEIERLKEETSIGLSEHENGVEQGRMEIINALSNFLDSLQKELASEDLEKEIDRFFNAEGIPVTECALRDTARHFAQWQKEQMMAKAIKATAHPEDYELWCDISKTNLQDGQEVKVIVIKED